jgi:hypothetical protein
MLGIIGFTALLIFAATSGRRRDMPCNRLGDIRVLSSDQYFAPGYHQGKSAVLIGMIRNEGTATLDAVELEVHFFDNSGKLIDVFAGTFSGPLKSHEEKPFKITGDNIHLPESDYHSHKIIVVGAYEAKN